MSVDVLLATYNNAAYIKPMMDSLLGQTNREFRLLVSDDASTDATYEILQHYVDRFGGRMQLIRREIQSGSAKQNFASIIAQSTADYIMFADGDDVWDNNKVELQLSVLSTFEGQLGTKTPIYLFSDVRIVDHEGEPKHSSHWNYKKIDPTRMKTLGRLLMAPPMLGCASACNRALIEAATPIPLDKVTGHDWWLLLVAHCLGYVKHMDLTLMDYRIHGSNASTPMKISLLNAIRRSRDIQKIRRGLDWRRKQAEALIEHLASRLNARDRSTLEAFARIDRRNWVARRWALASNDLLYLDPWRNVASFLFL